MVGEERFVAEREVLRVGEVEEALEAKKGGEKSAEEAERGDTLEASVSEASETDADGDAD